MSDKRDRWFVEGVAILDALNIGAHGRYLCPLCLEWFSSVEELTLEHAPPENVGGRHLALTCRACNHKAGHTIDAELRKAETFREFASQRMTQPMKGATFTFEFPSGSISQRGEFTFDGKGVSLGGVPKQNHPDVAPAIIRAFDETIATGSWADTKVHVAFPTPDMRLASIGWLRAGYLAAFASFGYSYVLHEELDVVRKQLGNPAARILERYCLMTNSGPLERRVIIAHEPAEYESVVAFTNNCAIFLPNIGSPGTYERLAKATWPPGTITLSGKVAKWPARPLYRFDRSRFASESGTAC